MHGQFQNLLVCHPLPGGKKWELDKTLVYIPLRFRSIEIPSEFVTDFASIPPLARMAGIVLMLDFILSQFWRFMYGVGFLAWLVVMVADEFFDDRLDAPAVVHDWCYRTRLHNRRDSDAILFDACLANDVPGWKARMVWLNVRLFGWIRYYSYRRRGAMNSLVMLRS